MRIHERLEREKKEKHVTGVGSEQEGSRAPGTEFRHVRVPLTGAWRT